MIGNANIERVVSITQIVFSLNSVTLNDIWLIRDFCDDNYWFIRFADSKYKFQCAKCIKFSMIFQTRNQIEVIE